MLIRISLIIEIVAGLAVGGLNFVMVKEKIVTLKSDLERETAAHQKFEKDFRQTKSALDKTNAILKQTEATLTETTDQRDKAVAALAEKTKSLEKTTEDLAKTRQERDSAQQELAAYKATGYTPQQITTFGKQLTGLQEATAATETENKLLAAKIVKLKNELNKYVPGSPPVFLPSDLAGKVLVSDPKWNFVVLNVGQNQGVLERGELLVNRNGRLVAKVIVSSVQKDRCVANILPGWQLGDVFEGDQVIPAYPES